MWLLQNKYIGEKKSYWQDFLLVWEHKHHAKKQQQLYDVIIHAWEGPEDIGFAPVPWQFLSSSPILQSSWPSQSHFSEMQRLLWHRNWSSAQRSSQPFCKQIQSNIT